ncbi:MAG: O-antigen ligase family protein, partial [Firmicutes bacterium]|nr:O-antigen ligase family protein [Bacillota bacterium]
MKKYGVIFIVLGGILTGLLAAANGFAAATVLIGIVCMAALLLSDYERATYILAAYALADYLMRNFGGGFASVWDELLLIAMVCLWMYKLFKERKAVPIKQTPLDMPLIFFISVMLFMLIINSPDYRISMEGFRATIQYMLWYFAALQLMKDKKSARNVCNALVLMGSAMALHGVYQYIIGAEMPAGWIDQNEYSVRTRVYSILTSPNIMGSFMTLCIPITVSLGMYEEENKKKRYLYFFFALMMCASLVFTFSRGAWIGFAVAAGVYIFMKDKRLIIPAVIAAVLVIFLVPSVGNRITYMLSDEYIESSLRGGRLIRWSQGLDILRMDPLMGVGLGHFGGAVAMNNEMKRYIGKELVKTFYMDNYYLKTAVETGIIGLISFAV